MDREGEISGYFGLGAVGLDLNALLEGGLHESKSEDRGQLNPKFETDTGVIELAVSYGQDDSSLLPTAAKKKRKRNRNKRRNKALQIENSENDLTSEVHSERTVLNSSSDPLDVQEMEVAMNEQLPPPDLGIQTGHEVEFITDFHSSDALNVEMLIAEAEHSFAQKNIEGVDEEAQEDTSPISSKESVRVIYHHIAEPKVSTYVAISQTDMSVVDGDVLSPTVDGSPRSISQSLIHEKPKAQSQPDIPFSVAVIQTRMANIKETVEDVNVTVELQLEDVQETVDIQLENVKDTVEQVEDVQEAAEQQVDVAKETVEQVEDDTAAKSTEKSLEVISSAFEEIEIKYPTWANNEDIVNGNYLKDEEESNPVTPWNFTPSDETYHVSTESNNLFQTFRRRSVINETGVTWGGSGTNSFRPFNFEQHAMEVEAHLMSLEGEINEETGLLPLDSHDSLGSGAPTAPYPSLDFLGIQQVKEHEIVQTYESELPLTPPAFEFEKWKESNPESVTEIQDILESILDLAVRESEALLEEAIPKEDDINESIDFNNSDSMNNLLILETSGDYISTYPHIELNTMHTEVSTESDESLSSTIPIDWVNDFDEGMKVESPWVDWTPRPSDMVIEDEANQKVQRLDSFKLVDDDSEPYFDAESFLSGETDDGNEFISAHGSPQSPHYGIYSRNIEENFGESDYTLINSIDCSCVIIDEFVHEGMLEQGAGVPMKELIDLFSLEKITEKLGTDSETVAFGEELDEKNGDLSPLENKFSQPENVGIGYEEFTTLEETNDTSARKEKGTVNGENGQITIIAPEKPEDIIEADEMVAKLIRKQIQTQTQQYEWPDFYPKVYVELSVANTEKERGRSLGRRMADGLRTVLPCMGSHKKGLGLVARDSLECLNSTTNSALTIPCADSIGTRKTRKTVTLPQNLKLI